MSRRDHGKVRIESYVIISAIPSRIPFRWQHPSSLTEIVSMTTSSLNGMPRANVTPRKSLNQQLDRLDQILDGLSDGLQAAVVDAVKDAVGVAVQVALREVLTHPELVARLAPVAVASPVAPVAPTPAPTKRGPSW